MVLKEMWSHHWRKLTRSLRLKQKPIPRWYHELRHSWGPRCLQPSPCLQLDLLPSLPMQQPHLQLGWLLLPVCVSVWKQKEHDYFLVQRLWWLANHGRCLLKEQMPHYNLCRRLQLLPRHHRLRPLPQQRLLLRQQQLLPILRRHLV